MRIAAAAARDDHRHAMSGLQLQEAAERQAGDQVLLHLPPSLSAVTKRSSSQRRQVQEPMRSLCSAYELASC